MFRIGEFVAHPGHGGCIIEDAHVQPWKGADGDFYRLKPVMDENCQVFVPMEGAKALGLRRIISAEEAKTLLHALPALQVEWQPDFKRRKEQGTEILKSNDIRELCAMVKVYICTDARNQISLTDGALFNSSKKKLISELALALGETTEWVDARILELVAPVADAV